LNSKKSLSSENVKVSVIMNCFNGEKFIQKAIDSVLDQTHQNLEIIFWDNQSTDNSARILKRMKDPRIKYFLSNNHTNLYTARNEALKCCCGDFIAFLDVDDLWEKDKLERQLRVFDNKDVNLVYSNYWLQIEKVKSDRVRKKIAFQGDLKSGWALESLCSKYNVGLLTVIIRTSFLRERGLKFNGYFHIIGDFDLVLRIAAVSQIGVVNLPLATYRMHGNNESCKNLDLELKELKLWRAEMFEKGNFSKPYIKKSIDQYVAAVEMKMCLASGEYGQLLKLVPLIGVKNCLKKTFRNMIALLSV